MYLKPLIEREWRHWQRKPWWQRPPHVLLLTFGGTVAVLGPMELFATDRWAAINLFPWVFSFALGAHVFAAGGSTSVLASESRSGSWSLLRLAGLGPRDLLVGQILNGLLVSAWAASGLIPWLLVGWMNSSLRISDLAAFALLWLLVGLSLQALIALIGSFGKTLSLATLVRAFAPVVAVFGSRALGSWMPVPGSAVNTGAQILPICGGLGLMAVLGLAMAYMRVARAERLVGHLSLETGPVVQRVHRRPLSRAPRRWLDRNPILWLAASSAPVWAWVLLAVGLSIPWMIGAVNAAELFSSTCWARGVLLTALGARSYAQAREDRRTGNWEVLLRTRLTPSEYVSGHQTAWWREHRPLLAILVVVPAIASLAVVPTGEAAHLLWSNLLLTWGDAAVVSVIFYALVQRTSSSEFPIGAVLFGFLVLLWQPVHVGFGANTTWPWVWATVATAFWLQGRRVLKRSEGERGLRKRDL